AEIARTEHVPAIVHVVEVTQPQGHSTSGSHERYKSAERLNWEREHDCNLRMRQWILDAGIADEPALIKLEEQALQQVDEIRRKVWEDYKRPIERERDEAAKHLRALAAVSPKGGELEDLASRLLKQQTPYRRDIMVAVRMALVSTLGESSEARNALARWRETQDAQVRRRYESHLYSESPRSALKVPVVPAEVGPESPRQTGFEILNACFEAALNRDPRVVAFGEDVGQLGDVNQGFKGLQEKFGPLRVSDTGIRECTIMGQAIGLALRGLRPIAEIQYLDYLLYGLQILSDDLSTLHWRTVGGQKAPVIVRTRGHRLEGIWHSGSPMAGIINNLRGMYVMVPRNMTQAAGFYNTMLQSDDPGLIVEVLNAYRQRERMPANVGTFTVPLGVPEILHPGRDLTLVTYGAMCPIALQAVQELEKIGISVELIDVQTLLPFDIHGAIVESLKKTSRVIFIDEDLPGGATAYMMQEVLEKQGGYRYLDSPPRTLTAGAHRPAYGSDGDYWSKPNTEEIMRICNRMMHEVAPDRYPRIF
nr:transketolase C-terminal domain-containing protein [Calditrichia bacterium]